MKEHKRHHILATTIIVGSIILSFITSPAWLILVGMFFPMIIADMRNHNNLLAISVLNMIILVASIVMMFIVLNESARIVIATHNGINPGRSEWYQTHLGLSPVLVGWLVALVWSFTSNVKVKLYK
jgi:hypothetical protein